MTRTITVDIDSSGVVKVEANGFNGVGCEAATKAFRDAMGVTEKTTFKPEYSQEVERLQGQQASQG